MKCRRFYERLTLTHGPVSGRITGIDLVTCGTLDEFLATGVTVRRITQSSSGLDCMFITCISVWYDDNEESRRARLKKIGEQPISELKLPEKLNIFLGRRKVGTVGRVTSWYLNHSFPAGFGKKSRAVVELKLKKLGLL